MAIITEESKKALVCFADGNNGKGVIDADLQNSLSVELGAGLDSGMGTPLCLRVSCRVLVIYCYQIFWISEIVSLGVGCCDKHPSIYFSLVAELCHLCLVFCVVWLGETENHDHSLLCNQQHFGPDLLNF